MTELLKPTYGYWLLQCPRASEHQDTLKQCRADYDQGLQGYPASRIPRLGGRRSSQCPAFSTYVYWWNLHIFSIIRKAPRLLHGRTAGSPCRDKSDRMKFITDPKLEEKKGGKDKGKKRKKEIKEGLKEQTSYLLSDCLCSWGLVCRFY